MRYSGGGDLKGWGGEGVEKNVPRRERPQSNEAQPDSKSVMATGILMAGCGPCQAWEHSGLKVEGKTQ